MGQGHPFDHATVTRDAEIRHAYSADASGMAHDPEAVARPTTEAEVVDLMQRCASHGVALTPQGLRSSTTGASVPERGIALALEQMSRIIEIDPVRRIAIAEPGVVLGEFKRTLREAGLFYPPDPTSENECSLGGTVACNASGSRTYRYGATRPWVRALRIVLADGAAQTVRRAGASKNTTGYYGFQDPIDLWIGSEGTLGIVTQVEVQCLPAPAGDFGAMAFFPSWREAIAFVLAADALRLRGLLEPRCLELFDATSLALVHLEAGGLRIPEGAGAAVFFEEEAEPGKEMESFERWYELIEAQHGLADLTIVAQSEAEKIALRRLRHAIPAGMNERGSRAQINGGRKVSTDFAVPLEQLPLLMEDCFAIGRDLFGGLTAGYGHVGNGHPHFNLIAEDAASLVKAQAAARRMAMRALELGGTLSAEHGIGKIKRSLLRELYPEWLLRAMASLKQTLDPKGLLAPGNIFE